MSASPVDDAGSRLSYCAAQVRRHDRDRYLSALFAPPVARERLFALYAFNLEVAKTAELVNEPMLGHIRLQWWREAIEGVYAGRPGAHAVIAALAEAVRGGGLTRGHFERLIEAREQDLDAAAPATMAALEAYAEGTSCTLIWLGLEALGAPHEAGRAAARHVGIAWALAGLLRAVPFHARQRRLYLPREVSAATGLAVAELFALRSSPALCAAVAQVAARAEAHLAAARRRRTGRLARAALPAMLPGALAARDLRALRRAGHDPFAPAMQGEHPGRIWPLAWAWLAGRYY